MEDKNTDKELMSISGQIVDSNSELSDITSSHELAEYLSKGGSLNAELPQVKSSQSDMKSYLSLYARSQLTRVEKLTSYLDKLEDKLMCNIDGYNPDQFLRAMQTLQSSLNSAIELIKLIGTDDQYLNIFYTENNAFINSLQLNNKIDIGLNRESRDRLRQIISKIQISGGNQNEETQ